MDRVKEFYEVKEMIGEGSFGVVFRCRDLKTGRSVAVKMLRIEDKFEGLPAIALREIGLVKGMNHPNIIKLLDVKVYEDHVYLIFECLHTNLSDFMDKNPEILRNPSQRKSFLKQILLGVAYFHGHGTIHRDLKHENLLIDESHKRLKLADFGFAKAYRNQVAFPLKVGSSPYMAPEVLLDCPQYSKAVDMWSVGVIFGEMVIHDSLFSGLTNYEVLLAIFSLLGTPNEETWPGVTELLAAYPSFPNHTPKNLHTEFPGLEPTGVDLLSKMLCLNPSQRITAHEALEHEYFNTQVARSPLDSFCCIT